MQLLPQGLDVRAEQVGHGRHRLGRIGPLAHAGDLGRGVRAVDGSDHPSSFREGSVAVIDLRGAPIQAAARILRMLFGPSSSPANADEAGAWAPASRTGER
ncbi:hypothetical protein LRS13_22225 [Svornostia abyssi]|uniref:Uncharacterized protein n=1 Tax=Svornostia abyssi TaxID=2898438 RepID=A0ABY5PFF1_9ACTN|nr:hypothetical protein LRS13_22225 [Parviterribacteraceae bacterium J379]